jgi:class 3 adenylate cyclase/Tfp pilus assembly protein PilF
MNIKYIFCLSFIWIFVTVHAQENALDSLNLIANNSSLPDTTRIQANEKLIQFWFSEKNFDSLKTCFDKQQKLVNQINSNKDKANLLFWEGKLLILSKKYEEAFQKIDSSFSILWALKENRSVALKAQETGIALFEQGLFTESTKHFSTALQEFEKLGDTIRFAGALGNIGISLRKEGNIFQAIQYFTRSLKLKEELKDSLGIANTLNSLGNLYLDIKEYESARKYFESANEIYESLNHLMGIGSALSNLGSVEMSLNNYHKAVELFERSIEVKQQTQHIRGILVSKINLAGTLFQLGELERSQQLFNECNEMLAKFGLESYRSSILLGQAEIYLKLKKYETARNLAKMAFDLDFEGSDYLGIINSSNLLAKALESLGDYKKALKYRNIQISYKDSLENEENLREIIHLHYQFDFEKKHLSDSINFIRYKELYEFKEELKVAKIEQTRNIFIFFGLVIFGIAIGLGSRLRYIRKTKNIMTKEKDRAENLLLNILPANIAAELKDKGKADARQFDVVSILFTDFIDFTEKSAKLSASDLVYEINQCFEAFDMIIMKYGIEKIKTIGDAYMAAGGLPVPTHDSVQNTVLAAIEMQEFIAKRKAERNAKGEIVFEMRAGIHTGPVVAGIVGVKKFQYDVWGDTVNTASRMESSGQVGKVNISEASYQMLKENPLFEFKSRGKIAAKGKGEIKMYFVNLKTEKEITDELSMRE